MDPTPVGPSSILFSPCNLNPLVSAVYVNALRVPWGADFNSPEKYGLAGMFPFYFQVRLIE